MARPRLLLATALAIVAVAVFAGLALAGPALQASPANVAAGGKLYDKWWTASPGAAAPTGDHPLWSTQTTNTRKGLDTWRCKECHGWDYLGKDGAYGSGSHRTGFAGVIEAGKSKTAAQLVAILKGASNPRHNFSPQLSDASLANLAAFLKEGLYDTKGVVDYPTRKPLNADMSRGRTSYGSTCAPCHGADGTKLNFGSEKDPEFIGTLAASNPQEFLHKVRAGQPGAAMPSAFESGWTLQDSANVLAFAQTLPIKAPAAPVAAVLPKTGGTSAPLLALALVGLGLAAAGWAVRRGVVRLTR
ncbi:MAG: c-type cytochrome [Chloroflexi bacterium]|nr:c-type cytochrome [Chloroflexota bacterium]